jgi:hypothetical protein
MTALGKTLTVFVFLLSLAWCWLTVNAYVTRANWQAQAAAYKKTAEDAVSRANAIKNAFDKTVASSDGQISKYALEIDRLNNKLTELVSQMAKITTNFEQLELGNKVAEDNKAKLEKNLEAISKQLDQLKISRDDLENKYVIAQRSEQDSKNFALSMKLESDAFKNRNETLEQQMQQLQSTLQDLKLGRTGLGSAQIIPVPAGLRGSVTAVSGELITISLGADAGLMKGAIVDLGRGDQYLGQVRISDLEPKRAVGTFTPVGGGRPNVNNLPKVGDNVGKFLNN